MNVCGVARHFVRVCVSLVSVETVSATPKIKRKTINEIYVRIFIYQN